VQRREAGSVLNFYRSSLWLRRGSQALLHGGYEPLPGEERVFSFLRPARDQTVLVTMNMHPEAARLLGQGMTPRRLLSNVRGNAAHEPLAPYEATSWEVVRA
jgi:glycosidase